MAKKMNQGAVSKKCCSCSMGKMIVGVILMALGLYAVVGGFNQQMNLANPNILGVLLYYLIGIFLICIGKFFKMASYLCCEAHNMCR